MVDQTSQVIGNMEDLDKVQKIKAFLGGIDKLTQGIDTTKLKNQGGLGTKDATLVDFLRQTISAFKDKNYL